MGSQPSKPAPAPPPPPPPPPAPIDERKQDGKYCRRVRLSEENAKNVRSIDDVRENELDEIQIQRMDIRSYSSNTKLFIIPSMPFEMSFNDSKFYVYRMTLYHPCPVRIENVQYDAVLSLNDPSDTNVSHIVLIPLKGVSVGAGESGKFISKLTSYIPAIVQPNANGEYVATDVPTGADWSIGKILKVGGNSSGEIEVKNGFFQWVGKPVLNQYTKGVDTQFPFQYTNVGWRQETNAPGPTYILMQEPSLISAYDLSTIRMLPVTEPEQAVHPIPAVFTFKSGPPNPALCNRKKETFVSSSCDPLTALSQAQTQTLDSETIVKIVLGILSGIAVFIGVYFALQYATGPVGNFFKNLGEKIGKAASGVNKELSKIPVPMELTQQIKKTEPREQPKFIKTSAIASKVEEKKGDDKIETINPMRLTQQQRQQIKKVEPPTTPDIRKPEYKGDVRKTQRTLQTYKNPRLQTRRQIPADKPKPLENEQINPMRLTQEQRQQIKKAEPTVVEPDIRKPEYKGDVRKTQRTLQTYKNPALRTKTMKNRSAVKTAEADKEDIAKLEQEIKDAAGTGLLTPEEMKIPPEQRKLFNGKVVKKRIITEELPDEDLQELKDLVAEKQEAEKKVEEDKQKGFEERLAADIAKVEDIDIKIKEQEAITKEAIQRIKDRRRKTTRAILEEAKKRKKETEQTKPQTKLFGPLPKGRSYPIGYRGQRGGRKH